jgi:hypothetical protein
VPRAADALQEGGDAVRRGDLAHEVDVADVDAELEGGGGHQHLELPFAQPLLRVQAHFLRQAAVVSGDVLGPEPFRELVRHALGEAPRVHGDERGAVRADQLHQPLVDFLPDLVRHHRLERRAGHLDRQVERASVALVYDLTGEEVRNLATSSIGFWVAESPMRWSLRPQTWSRRSSDSARCAPRRDWSTAWISSTITARGALQDLARARGGEQQVERLGRGDENMRRRAQHRGALGLRRVAASHRRGDFRPG